MSAKFLIASAFFAGFATCGVLQTAGIRFISDARADVAGMSAYQLEHDYAFRQAVRNIVEEECKTDLKFWNNGNNYRTYHYCNPGSRYAP